MMMSEPLTSPVTDISTLDQASLARLVEELQISKTALESRRFIEAGLARFADVMRWRAEDSLPAWVDRLLEDLMPTIGGLHAALYLSTETENNEVYLTLAGSYAGLKDKTHEYLRLGEGLVGQVAKSKISRYIDDPELVGVVTGSALTELQPAVVQILALNYNEQLQGVLEVSAAEPFRPEALEMLRQLSGVIAANLLTIQNQERTQRLYKEMKENAQVLAAHEEEMRKNLEMVTATQNELREAKNEIEYRQKMMERITGNVPGMLFQYVKNVINGEERYTFVSERSKNILYLTPTEVMEAQNAITDRLHPEDKNSFIEAFRHSGDNMLPLSWTGRILTPDGNFRWIRAESTPSNETEYLIVWDGYLYDITSEKERELEEARRQQQLTIAANLAELGFMEFDFEADRLSFSDEMCRIFSLQPDSSIEDFFALIHIEDRDAIVSEINELKDKYQPFNHEYRIRTPQGKILWIKSGGQVLFNRFNKPETALVIVQDITLQKQRAAEIEENNKILAAREEELSKNVAQLEAGRQEIDNLLERQNLLFKSSRDAIWIIKDDKTFDCNPAFLRLFGFSDKDAAMNTRVNDFLPPVQPSGDDSIKIWENLIEDCHYHGSSLWEWKNIKADGTVFDAEIALSSFAYQNESYIQATIRDISERKAQQTELLKRQMHLELAESLGKLGAFEVVKDTDTVVLSRSLHSILELPNDRPLTSLDELFNLVFEEDLHFFTEVINGALSGNINTGSLDFRVKIPHNRYRWLHMTVIGMYDESSALIGLEGMCQDITTAKEREELITRHNMELETREEMLRENVDQLQKAQKELKSVSERQNLLFETARDAIFIMDGLTILDCNPAAIRMIDVPLKEYLIKRKISDLSPEYQPGGEHSLAALTILNDAALAGGNNKIEWVLVSHKGAPLDVEITMSPFIYQGKMMMQTTVRDISNRKARDREIRNQKAFVESLIQSAKDMIIVTDLQGKVLLANAEYFPFLSAEDHQVEIGHPIEKYLDEDRKETFRSLIDYALTGEAASTDSGTDKDGKRFYYETNFIPVKDRADKIIAVQIVGSDITPRKQREIEIMEEENVRNQSEEIGRTGTYIYDLITGHIRWSTGSFLIFEIPKEKGTPTIDYFMTDIVHSEDVSRMDESIGRSIKEGIPVEIDYRANAGGKMKYIYSYIRPIKDVNGKVVKLIGLNHDVSQYRKEVVENVPLHNEGINPATDISEELLKLKEQAETLERSLKQSDKQFKDLDAEYKLARKKLSEFKEKEMSLLEIIQVKDQEIDRLNKKFGKN